MMQKSPLLTRRYEASSYALEDVDLEELDAYPVLMISTPFELKIGSTTHRAERASVDIRNKSIGF